MVLGGAVAEAREKVEASALPLRAADWALPLALALPARVSATEKEEASLGPL